jgi:hypothetical protein
MKATRLLGIIFNKATETIPLSSSLTDVCIYQVFEEKILYPNTRLRRYIYIYQYDYRHFFLPNQHLTSECMICHVE